MRQFLPRLKAEASLALFGEQLGVILDVVPLLAGPTKQSSRKENMRGSKAKGELPPMTG